MKRLFLAAQGGLEGHGARIGSRSVKFGIHFLEAVRGGGRGFIVCMRLSSKSMAPNSEGREPVI